MKCRSDPCGCSIDFSRGDLHGRPLGCGAGTFRCARWTGTRKAIKVSQWASIHARQSGSASACRVILSVSEGSHALGTEILRFAQNDTGEAIRLSLYVTLAWGTDGAMYWKYMSWLVNLYQQGRLKLDELITARYSLEQINEAIELTERGEATRNMIIWWNAITCYQGQSPRSLKQSIVCS